MPEKNGSFAGFVDVRCQCGKLHTLLREQVLEGLSTSRWKCGGCKSRFIVACTPGDGGSPDVFWAIYLDGVPTSGDTHQEGFTTEDPGTPEAPAQMHFQCRCGCKLVGKSGMYGRPVRCPRCSSKIVVRVGKAAGQPAPVLEFPD